MSVCDLSVKTHEKWVAEGQRQNQEGLRGLGLAVTRDTSRVGYRTE